MAPIASGSGSGDVKPRTKLTATETKLNKTGLAAPNKTISQSDLIAKSGLAINDDLQASINTLLRLNLCSMLKDASGQIIFRFMGKDEAKALGSMDSEEKLVLDRIRDADNQGIWTKTLKTRTGLPPSTITKVLKSLESKKAIKAVKSVKAPTKKIYMLASITPSVDVTGGPWFTDNELDTEFVDALKRLALKYISEKSIPDQKSKALYPTSTTIFLPRVSDVRKHISSLNIATVELKDDHVLSLLELMAFDNLIEKVLIQDVERFMRERNGANGKRKRGEGSEDEGPRKRKKKVGGVKKVGKKTLLRRMDDDDEDEEEEEESDFDEDEDAATAAARSKKSTSVRRKSRNKRAAVVESEDEGSTSESSGGSDSENEGGLGGEEENALPDDFVWRIIPATKTRIGWTDMPCGLCPVESFCTASSLSKRPTNTLKTRNIIWNLDGSKAKVPVVLEGTLQGVGMMGGVGAAIGASNEKWGEVGGRVGEKVAPVNPRDCVYFKEWLDF